MTTNPLTRQVGGSHYQTQGIQTIEFIERNRIPFSLGCAIKYVTRWRLKGGVQDLEKAVHYLEFAEMFGTVVPDTRKEISIKDFAISNDISADDTVIIAHIVVGDLEHARCLLKELIRANTP